MRHYNFDSVRTRCGLKPPDTKSGLEPADGSDDGSSWVGEEEGAAFLQMGEKTSGKSVKNAAGEPAPRGRRRSSASPTLRPPTRSLLQRLARGRSFEQNDKELFSFQAGAWSCGDAALPPKIKSPTTYLWEDRGYVVFPKQACEGEAFVQKCYCWDEGERLAGVAVEGEEQMCDGGCGKGPCAGFGKCGVEPPPPPPEPAPPTLPDPVEAEELGAEEVKTSEVVVDQNGQ